MPRMKLNFSLFLTLSFTLSFTLSWMLPSSSAESKEAVNKPPDKSLWFDWKGKRVFLFGMNYPWYNGFRSLDFGKLQGTREIAGVAMIKQKGFDIQKPAVPIPPGSTGFDAAGIDAQLKDMESMNIHVLRWFFGGDGRSFMNFDKDGNCTGVEKETLDNVAKALDLAKKHHIFIAPCLLDFRFVCGDKFVTYTDGKPAPFYAHVLRDEKKRRLLIDKFIKVLAAKFTDSDSILYWEIMNECGNVVNGSDPKTGFTMHGGEMRAKDRRVTQVEMQTFLNEAYDAIKSVDKKHPVMPSGLARPNQLPLIIGKVKADIYGAHYNDNGSDRSMIQTIEQLNEELKRYKTKIDKPLVMTEGPAVVDRHVDDYIKAAYDGGWAGMLPWQYYQAVGLNDFLRYKRVVTSKDGNLKAKDNIEFYKRFAAEHADEISFDKVAKPRSTKK